MNSDTSLYFRSEAASWKGAEEGVSVACLNMGSQAGRLKKCSCAELAVECLRRSRGIGGVLLEMVVHRALIRLFCPTVRAKKLAIFCSSVCERHKRGSDSLPRAG